MWTEVTPILREAANELRSELTLPLIVSESFTYDEGLIAIELCDEKMDCCTRAAGVLNNMTVSELFNAVVPTTPIELLAVLRAALSMHVSLFSGEAPLDSVRRVTFLWEGSWPSLQAVIDAKGPDALHASVLLAAGHTLAKAAELIHSCHVTADVYEDEDYATKSCEEVPYTTEWLYSELDDVESSLSVISEEVYVCILQIMVTLRHWLVTLNAVDKFINNAISASNDLLSSRRAVIAAVTEANETYVSQAAVSTPKISHEEACHPATLAPNAVRTALTVAVPTVESIATTLGPLAESLELLFNQPSELVNGFTVMEGSHPLFRGLLPVLHATCPLKKLQPFDSQASISVWKSAVKDLIHACKSCDALYCKNAGDIVKKAESLKANPEALKVAMAEATPESLTALYEASCTPIDGSNSQLTIEALLTFAWHTASAHWHILARDVQVAAYHAIALSLPSIVERSLLTRGVPTSFMSVPLVPTWLPAAPTAATWNTLRAFVSPPNRLVDRVTKCFSQWGTVAVQARQIDDCAAVALGLSRQRTDGSVTYFTGWALSIGGWIGSTVLASLETSDLLANRELDTVHWMGDYLAASGHWGGESLRRQQHALQVRMATDAATDGENAVVEALGRKATAAKKKSVRDTFRASLPPLPSAPITPREDYVLKGRGELRRGVFRLALVCKKLNLLSSKPLPFTYEETSFSLRFHPFAELQQPPGLSYADYQRSVLRIPVPKDDSREALMEAMKKAPEIDVLPILKSVEVAFASARTSFESAKTAPSFLSNIAFEEESLNEVMVLTKVAVASRLFVSRLIAGLGPDGRIPSTHVGTLKIHRQYGANFPVLEVSITATQK